MKIHIELHWNHHYEHLDHTSSNVSNKWLYTFACKITNRWVVAATKAPDLSKAANKDTCGRWGQHLPEGHRWWTCRRGWCANAYKGKRCTGEGPKGKNTCLGKNYWQATRLRRKEHQQFATRRHQEIYTSWPIYWEKPEEVLAGCNDMNLRRVLLGLSRISPTHPWWSDEWQLFLLPYPSILYWLNVCDTWLNAELCTYIAHERWCSWLYLPTLWSAKWNYKANSIEYQLLSVSEIVELFRPQFAWSKSILPVSKQLNLTYVSHKPIHEILSVKVRVAAVEW